MSLDDRRLRRHGKAALVAAAGNKARRSCLAERRLPAPVLTASSRGQTRRMKRLHPRHSPAMPGHASQGLPGSAVSWPARGRHRKPASRGRPPGRPGRLRPSDTSHSVASRPRDDVQARSSQPSAIRAVVPSPNQPVTASQGDCQCTRGGSRRPSGHRCMSPTAPRTARKGRR